MLDQVGEAARGRLDPFPIHGRRGCADLQVREGRVRDSDDDEARTEFTVSQAKQFVNTARAGAGDGLQVAVNGQVAEQSERPAWEAPGLGALAALIVLLIVFGSLFAAVLPLLTAGIALGVGVSVVGLLSHLITMATFSEQLSILIGLGVGVDYALFIVTRHRQGLQRASPSRRR